jgi:hypothetical protein
VKKRKKVNYRKSEQACGALRAKGPKLTLVVDGVPESEERQHGEDDGRGRSVLAVEVACFDAANSRRGRRALRELRVEGDEWVEVRALPSRLVCGVVSIRASKFVFKRDRKRKRKRKRKERSLVS